MGDRLACLVFLAESDKSQSSIVMRLDRLLILSQCLFRAGQRLVKQPIWLRLGVFVEADSLLLSGLREPIGGAIEQGIH